jgi:hypothetical protein
MYPMQRKPPQQTLSMRVSRELRNYLEESAIADHLDDRLTVADLWIRPAEALWTIRCKWEQHQDLSRAEWMIFQARCVQAGCEELAQDPELPCPESFAQVLKAFLRSAA